MPPVQLFIRTVSTDNNRDCKSISFFYNCKRFADKDFQDKKIGREEDARQEDKRQKNQESRQEDPR
jgi:hypothetical protein